LSSPDFYPRSYPRRSSRSQPLAGSTGGVTDTKPAASPSPSSHFTVRFELLPSICSEAWSREKMARNFGKPALLGAAFCLSACGNAQGDSELLNQTRQFAIEVSQTWSTPKFSSASAIAALKTRSL
jgi:hypothetical protein